MAIHGKLYVTLEILLKISVPTRNLFAVLQYRTIYHVYQYTMLYIFEIFCYPDVIYLCTVIDIENVFQ